MRKEIKHATVPEFNPSVTLLVKLGSIAVHADEMMSDDGHKFDRIALQGLLADPEVAAWLQAMGKMAMLPLKRK
jgi:hypothetical protein